MRVAVITEDARVYYLIVKTLKAYGIGFHSLRPGEKIPFDVEAVLTDEKSFGKVDFPVKIVVRDESFVDELLAVLEGRERFKQVFIAIDPGERPGLSVVADNRVLEVHRLKGPRDVGIIIDLLERYPGAKIKIGHGAKRQRTLTLKALGQLLGYDYPVILVNEARTTPRVGNTEASGVQDIVASINIGLRRGRETTIADLLEVKEPTKRELEDIKRRSRELSGNVTISTSLAREVALGNMTLEEAIEKQRRRKG
ncbi:hypothetical protein A3L09_04305 [Thermococcus profundus]|uniref:Nuclease n=1 Tax=Thermococcus profundus TaxID=49899 RepID=A0A2Z2MJC4_THEPR|nr:hypothetical protein [Thermococcus profundus]ASJ02531.1 hypothetical protein A3L09_04305 [Thermococcus profundus]